MNQVGGALREELGGQAIRLQPAACASIASDTAWRSGTGIVSIH